MTDEKAIDILEATDQGTVIDDDLSEKGQGFGKLRKALVNFTCEKDWETVLTKYEGFTISEILSGHAYDMVMIAWVKKEGQRLVKEFSEKMNALLEEVWL